MTTTTELMQLIVTLGEKIRQPYFNLDNHPTDGEEEDIVFCAAGDGLIKCHQACEESGHTPLNLRNRSHFR
ncbi:TPA: hypothetical protein ACSRGI_004234 [Klebsiella variicola subsp. variicola]|uniref:hypothetical protein n=1 Tax=Klebsiella variicola TaxID=244366 RepID=UPI003FA5C809